MPSSGGEAGKAGDRYEVLWAIDAALRVIRGNANDLTYESLDPDLSRGVEFHVRTQSITEFWSVKRQTAGAAGWTLNLLTQKDAKSGRSILGDLIGHADRDDRNRLVFASSQAAPKLSELHAVADASETLKARLRASAGLSGEFAKYLLPQFAGDSECCRRFLKRVSVRTVDETSLRAQIEDAIGQSLYSVHGPVDAADVRRNLGEFLLDRLNATLRADELRGYLAEKGFHVRDWKSDSSVQQKVADLCDGYAEPLRASLIGETLLSLPDADRLSGPDGLPPSRRVLVTAGAGGGKSSELAALVGRLRERGVPVLPVRLDQLPEGMISPEKLGEQLALPYPYSPVAVLAGVAEGDDAVLVVDQLDAVSEVSGRRTEAWGMFEAILKQAGRHPNLRVVTACREFDLEHDHRMRKLKGEGASFTRIKLGSLNDEVLDKVLAGRTVHPKLRPLLAVPLHLSMFLTLRPEDAGGFRSRDELFRAFWAKKRRAANAILDHARDFDAYVRRLTHWMSENQTLTAPRDGFDGPEADALASEHVLVLTEGGYRFFHEAFFDYLFARGFAMSGRLLDLLKSSEQLLFRRGQVRQVLSYLRATSGERYERELRDVLLSGDVRFHIKRAALQHLSAVEEPRAGEWRVLREMETADPDLRDHVFGTILNHPGWFDLLDGLGLLDKWLSGADPTERERCVSLLARSAVLEQRGGRIAELLKKHRCDGDDWNRYLRYVCLTGDVHHHRDLFDLFLSLVRDGTLEEAEDNRRGWWSSLYTMSEDRPDLLAEVVGVWLEDRLKSLKDDCAWRHLEDNGPDDGVIAKAAAEPLVFVSEVLPRVAGFLGEHAAKQEDRLDRDPLWTSRSFSSSGCLLHATILGELAGALDKLAKSRPAELDRLLDPYVDRPQDAMAYIVLRAWTAAPERYSERLAGYLAADPRRLKIGYASWSGGGERAVVVSHRSIVAVRAAASVCSNDAFAALERAVLGLKDSWEARNPKIRGERQLRLLTAMGEERLGEAGHAKLEELRAKFPKAKYDAPKPTGGGFVISPIAPAAQEKMTDAHWLSAMRRYADVDHEWADNGRATGGERQLGSDLARNAQADPHRFAALASKMSDEMPACYFDNILMGVADAVSQAADGNVPVLVAEVTPLLERVHALPDRPCGRWIGYLIGRWEGADWPASVLDLVAWYAEHDPSPTEELWRQQAEGGGTYYNGDPEEQGLNYCRGAIAGAVAGLLFDDPTRAEVLAPTVDRLAHDPSVAVRSRAIEALLAYLNVEPELSIRWFLECVELDPALLEVRPTIRFLRHAAHRDHAAVRPVLRRMLDGPSEKAVRAAAETCCLLELEIPDSAAIEEDADGVRRGTSQMRLAAARVYQANVAHDEVGATCRGFVEPLLSDEDDAVRAEAAHAFRHLPELGGTEQRDLLNAFLDTEPTPDSLEPVARALGKSAEKLPDLAVCRLVEVAVTALGDDASSIQKQTASVADAISKIVLRLYAQTNDTEVRCRCLDAIDRMARARVYGLASELERLDR